MKPINEWTLQECILAMKHGAPMENFKGGITRIRLSPVMIFDVANRIQSLTDAQSKREVELVDALKAISQLGDNDADCNHSGEYLDARKIARQAIASSGGKERSIYCQLDENSYCTHCGGHEHLCRQAIAKAEGK